MFAVIAAVIVVTPIALGQQITGTSESILLQFGENGITKNMYTTYFVEETKRVYQEQYVTNAEVKNKLNHMIYYVKIGETWNRCYYYAGSNLCQCTPQLPFVRQTLCYPAVGEQRTERTIKVGPYSFNVTAINRSNPTRTIYCTKEQIPVYHEYFNPTYYNRVFTTKWYRSNSTYTLPKSCHPW